MMDLEGNFIIVVIALLSLVPIVIFLCFSSATHYFADDAFHFVSFRRLKVKTADLSKDEERESKGLKCKSNRCTFGISR